MTENSDGSVVIRFDSDVSDAEKKIGRLKTEIQNLKTEISEKEFKHGIINEQLHALEAQIEAQKKLVEQLKAEDPTSDKYRRASEHLAEMNKQYKDLVAQSDKLASSIEKDTLDLQAMQHAGGELLQQVNEASVEVDEASQSTGKLRDAADGAAGGFDKLLHRISKLASGVFIFSMITSGLRAVRSYMGDLLATNSEYNAQLAKLRGALLTAFQPIYEYILPGLIAVLRVLTEIVQVVANVISTLLGKTTKQSAENAKALNVQASAISGVGSAAKEASKSLASFDQINKLDSDSTIGSGGGGGGGVSGAEPDFSDFDTQIYKDKIDELTVYLSGALLALGAILAFSGAHPILGISLMAAGAAGLVSVVKENWGAMSGGLKKALTNVALILGVSSFAIGAILTFSGAKPALGIALMAAGAAGVITAAALNWGAVTELLNGTLGEIIAIFTPYLLCFGAILAFSGADIKLGIALMAAGFAGFAITRNITWGAMSQEIKNEVTGIMAILGVALLALGAILAFSGADIKLGIALMAAGAAGVITAAALNWGAITEALQGPLGEIIAIGSTLFLAIGLVLAFTGISPSLGIALIAAGAVGLVSVAALNWNAIQQSLQGPFGEIVALVSGNLLVIGLLLCLSSVGLPLGIALIAAGAAGLVTVTALNWNAILEKLKGAWEDIKKWFNESVKPKFTLSYWQEVFSGIGKGLKEAIKEGINGAIDRFNQFISWVNDAMNFSWGDSDIKNPFTKEPVIKGGSVQLIKIPSIPKLAQGTVIPPNAPFLAMLGDQRSGTNVEAPLSTIQQAVSGVTRSSEQIRLLQEQNRLLSMILERCDIKLDGRSITETVNRYQRQMERSSGGLGYGSI